MVRVASLVCVLAVCLHATATSTLARRDLLTHGGRMGEGGRASGSANTAAKDAIAKAPSVTAQLSKATTSATAQFQKQSTAKAAATGARHLLTHGGRMGEGGRASGSANTAAKDAIAKAPSVTAQLSKATTSATAQFQKQSTAKAAATGARHLLTHGGRMGEGGRASGSANTAAKDAIAKAPSVTAQLSKATTSATAQFQKQGTSASFRNVMPEKSSGPELGAIERMPKL